MQQSFRAAPSNAKIPGVDRRDMVTAVGRDVMERLDAGICECDFGLLCSASAAALALFGLAFVALT